MTDQGLPETESARAWRAQVDYHRDRAAQEQRLARRAQSETARSAHHALSEHHLQLAASAELVADMADAEPPQSSALQHTGWLMRESYGDAS
ncbi:MAG: hypothetical protein V4595_10910 [Pseudomonadota bacterium]